MKNILKLSFLVLLTAVMVTLVGCGSETGPIPTLGPYEHSGFI
jgi:predicted small lipoprotein YifL